MARKKIRITAEERRAGEERARIIDEYLAKLELRIERGDPPRSETVPYGQTTRDERTTMIDDYIAKLSRRIEEKKAAASG